MLESFCKDIYDLLSKKHPNKRIFVTSDEHFYHQNILNYTRKEFSSLEDMHNHIINRFNSKITSDDIVIFLGDFSFKTPEIRNLLARLNGHKYMILGNHDSPDLVKSYPSLGFEGLWKGPIRLNGDFLSHEPLVEGQNSTIPFRLALNDFLESKQKNYHGHVHDKDFGAGESYVNAVLEATDYMPIYVGNTKSLVDDNPLFINSPYFEKSLEKIQKENGLNPRFVIMDYIYAYMLSKLNPYFDKALVQGSYGLYKKYGFISNFSDLDISYLFEPSSSKAVNTNLFKNMCDDIYLQMHAFDRGDVNYFKRYASLRIFEFTYATSHPYFVRCFYDANLIFLDSYHEEDFVIKESQSTLQTLLLRNGISYSDYEFPSFKARFLSPTADLANLLLQILFQEDHEQAKVLALKKLQFLYRHNISYEDLLDFENVFSRFFLRNVDLLATLHRQREVEGLKKSQEDFLYVINKLPSSLKKIVSNILLRDSGFMDIYNQIISSDFSSTCEKCQELIRHL